MVNFDVESLIVILVFPALVILVSPATSKPFETSIYFVACFSLLISCIFSGKTRQIGLSRYLNLNFFRLRCI